MRQILAALAIVFIASVTLPRAGAAETIEKRVAFVVGNSSYAAGALPTAANDAGLVAQTLQAAGFDVIGARDLDADTFRQSYSEFLRRLSADGPNTVAFVYVSGYGLQYGNENYLVPIAATLARDLDIPVEAIRLNDLIGPLAGLDLKARFAVFDAAYPTPFAKQGAPLAGGLALVDASPGSLVAYNAAPGTVAPIGKDNYGAYAQALAAMMREGGIAPDEVFDRVRLQVNESTKGAEVPWDSSKIDTAFRFFERSPDAPASSAAPAARLADLRTKPIAQFPVKDAYTAALDRDTIGGYEQFIAAYGRDPLAKRVRALAAARREAITWNRSSVVDTPDAYWSYLRRYPRGPHVGDARLRLRALAAAYDPPSSFSAIPYDVPPPPPEEITYIDSPVIYFDDPGYDFAPPPPPPIDFLPPIPEDFVYLAAPPPPDGLFFLPSPVFVPLPLYINPPDYVSRPQNNVFYGTQTTTITNTTINNTTTGANTANVTPAVVRNVAIHQPLTTATAAAAAAPDGTTPTPSTATAPKARAFVALPASAAKRTNSLQAQGIKTTSDLAKLRAEGKVGGINGATGSAAQTLPGANGKPLPQISGKPAPGAVGGPPSATADVTAPNARSAPVGQASAPKGQVVSLKEQALSPKEKALSAKEQAATPNSQAVQPKGQAALPKGQAALPKGQATALPHHDSVDAARPAPQKPVETAADRQRLQKDQPHAVAAPHLETAKARSAAQHQENAAKAAVARPAPRPNVPHAAAAHVAPERQAPHVAPHPAAAQRPAPVRAAPPPQVAPRPTAPQPRAAPPHPAAPAPRAAPPRPAPAPPRPAPAPHPAAPARPGPGDGKPKHP